MDTHARRWSAHLVMTRAHPGAARGGLRRLDAARPAAANGSAPRGMTVPEAEVDLRPGGLHRTLMRDAAGKEYPNHLTIDAVDAPHRLVLRVADDACGPLVGTIGELLFDCPTAVGTRFVARWHHPTPEMRAAHEAMGFAKGWGETLDKLGACPDAGRGGLPHGDAGDARSMAGCIACWAPGRYETECEPPPGQDGPMRRPAASSACARSAATGWSARARAPCPGAGPRPQRDHHGLRPAHAALHGHLRRAR